PQEPLGRRAAQGGAPQDPPTGPRRGMGAVFAKHPTAWLVSAAAVAFVLLGTGSVFAGVAVGSTPEAVSTPKPVQTTEAPRPVPSTPPPAVALRTCSVSSRASVPQLGSLNASVINTATGEVLFDRAADAGVAT